MDILTQLAPALHGLYRAISSTSFAWSTSQWQQLREALGGLCSVDNIDRLNRLIGDIVNEDVADVDTQPFIETFLARYVSRGRPLSGYFIVCCVLETSWTVLAQVQAPPQTGPIGNSTEAVAANKAWNSLMKRAAIELDITEEATVATLKSTIQYAMQCFNDLLIQIEDMDTDPPPDTYAWETMSESLVRYFHLPLKLHSDMASSRNWLQFVLWLSTNSTMNCIRDFCYYSARSHPSLIILSKRLR